MWIILSSDKSQLGQLRIHTDVKKKKSLTEHVKLKKFNPDHAHTVHHTRANTHWTLCNLIFLTNSFPPCQVGGLSILPNHIRFPLSPRSQLLSDRRSCALLISISCRFHFPRQRQRENKRRWVRGGTNTLTHHCGVTTYYHLQPCCTEKKWHTLCFTHMQAPMYRPTTWQCKCRLTAGWCFPISLWMFNLKNTFLH